MLDTLYGKTFLILGSQLALTWLSTLMLLGVFRRLYHARTAWVSGGPNADGQLDLDLDWSIVKPYFWLLLGVDFVVFLALIFLGTENLRLGLVLFSVWSVLTGIELALCLVSVDENLGARVLALTALITCAAGLIGVRSGLDFSGLDQGLFYALLGLIGLGLIRIIFAIPRWVQRLWALFGVLVFIGYLLFDFHQLRRASTDVAANSWPEAMRIAIDIYLDIINLFLQLLDLLSD